MAFTNERHLVLGVALERALVQFGYLFGRFEGKGKRKNGGRGRLDWIEPDLLALGAGKAAEGDK